MLRIQLSLFAIILSALGTVAMNGLLMSSNLNPATGMLVGGTLAGIGITTLFVVERFRGVVGSVLVLASTIIGYTSYSVAQYVPESESTGALLAIGLVSLLIGTIITLLPVYLLTEE